MPRPRSEIKILDTETCVNRKLKKKKKEENISNLVSWTWKECGNEFLLQVSKISKLPDKKRERQRVSSSSVRLCHLTCKSFRRDRWYPWNMCENWRKLLALAHPLPKKHREGRRWNGKRRSGARRRACEKSKGTKVLGSCDRSGK